jgi:hypothetical protein
MLNVVVHVVLCYKSLYIKAKRAGWLTFCLCVRVARRRWAVAMQRGRFLFGQF